MNCDEFHEQVDDLALGQLEEPSRSAALAHAAGCQSCQTLLAGLGGVADRLLLAAPQLEPPAGFESRALARMGASTATRTGRWVTAVAAVLIVVAGAVLWWAANDDAASDVVAARIEAADDVTIGAVELRSTPTPHVLVMIDAPRPDPGTRTCELQREDGTWVSVGSWEVDDIAAGVWAVGIAPELLDATAMRIVADDGTVLAAADFNS